MARGHAYREVRPGCQTLYSLRDIVDTTIANVRKQFYAVLLDRAIINVQEESIGLLGSQLSDQQNRFQAGTVPRFNVLQAEVAVANARPQLIQARNDYNIAELNLARTLGISSGSAAWWACPPINPQGILTTDEKPEPLGRGAGTGEGAPPFPQGAARADPHPGREHQGGAGRLSAPARGGCRLRGA